MNANNRVRMFAIVVLLLGLGIASGITLSPAEPFQVIEQYPRGISSFSEVCSFGIDANTIIESLDRGQSDAFLPEAPMSEPTATNESTRWHQADYLKVANALNQLVWRDSLQSWSIFKMFFDTGCSEQFTGFDSAEFTFYKPFFRGGKLGYDARERDVSPRYEIVSWGGGTSFPRPIFGAGTVVFEKVRINAEQSLNIAEANGGKEASRSVRNKCDLYLVLQKNWLVVYEGEGGLPIYGIRIDPISGEVLEQAYRLGDSQMQRVRWNEKGKRSP